MKSFRLSSQFGERLYQFYYDFYKNSYYHTYKISEKFIYMKITTFSKIVLTVDVDQIVEQTMKEANPAKPGYITYDE